MFLFSVAHCFESLCPNEYYPSQAKQEPVSMHNLVLARQRLIFDINTYHISASPIFLFIFFNIVWVFKHSFTSRDLMTTVAIVHAVIYIYI